MGEESRRVKEHIDLTRDQLGRDIDRLQVKARSTLDWRSQFEERPMTMIGIAFGAGILMSTLSLNRRPRLQSTESPRSGGTTSPNAQKAMQVWDRVKGALVGVAAVRVQEFLEDVVPGFRREYEKVASERNENPMVKAKSASAD